MSFAAGAASKAARAVAERAGPIAAGTAAALAVQSAAAAPAQAREVLSPRGGAGPSSGVLAAISRIQDEFTLVDFDGSKPIFKPVFSDDEIADAAAAFRSLVGEDPGSDTSEGSAADAVIEASYDVTGRGGPGGIASPRAGPGALRQAELSAALMIATRVLKSPGVQREIAAAALTDPVVLEALGAKPDLDAYLVSQGFAARGLLPAPQRATSDAAVVTELDGSEAARARDEGGLMEGAGGGGVDPVAQLVDGLVRGLEWTGERLSELGQWLRGRLRGGEEGAAEAEAGAGAEAAGKEGAGAAGAAGKARRARAGVGQVMEKVSAVAAVLVVLMIIARLVRRG